jgi:acetamidase/formamidase
MFELLQPGRGEIPADVYVSGDPETLRWGRFPVPGDDPIARIADAGAVTVDTVSHEGLLGDQGADAVEFFDRFGITSSEVLDDVRALRGSSTTRDGDDGPHAMIGPFEVEGAERGDVLCVEVLDLQYRAPYGIVSNRHGRGVLAGELPHLDTDGNHPSVVSVLARLDGPDRGRIDTPSGHSLRFALRPFLGLVGVTPDATTPVSSTPPGAHGGNLDIRRLGVGTRLFLPVQVDGAGLCVADPHYAQGDGEVALTAFEAPLRATLRTSIVRGEEARTFGRLARAPWGETRTHTVVVGLGDDVDAALRACVRNAITFVTARTGVDEASALAFLSAAGDFQISQAVNFVAGVHCLIRTSDLDG